MYIGEELQLADSLVPKLLCACTYLSWYYVVIDPHEIILQVGHVTPPCMWGVGLAMRLACMHAHQFGEMRVDTMKSTKVQTPAQCTVLTQQNNDYTFIGQLKVYEYVVL